MSFENAAVRAHRVLIPNVAIPAVAVAMTAAVALTGCSSGSSKASPGSAGGTSSSSTSAAATSSSVAASSAASSAAASSSSAAPTGSTGSAQESLAARMVGGIGGVSSVHLAGKVTSSVAGGSAVIAADEKLANGKTTALKLSETVAGQNIGFVIIGPRAWVKLPTASPAKPWAVVTATSSNTEIRTIAASLARTTTQTSLTGYISFAKAATAIKKVGSETIDGVSTTHYSMSVDVAKLTSSESTKALTALGITSVPTNIWLDSHGRAVRVSEALAFRGQRITTTIDLTKYNVPVSISPPPASQISG